MPRWSFQSRHAAAQTAPSVASPAPPPSGVFGSPAPNPPSSSPHVPHAAAPAATAAPHCGHAADGCVAGGSTTSRHCGQTPPPAGCVEGKRFPQVPHSTIGPAMRGPAGVVGNGTGRPQPAWS